MVAYRVLCLINPRSITDQFKIGNSVAPGTSPVRTRSLLARPQTFHPGNSGASGCRKCFVAKPRSPIEALESKGRRLFAVSMPIHGAVGSSQVRNYSPGYMEQAPSRGHEASPPERAGCGLKAVLQQQKSCVGLLSWVGPRAPIYLL